MWSRPCSFYALILIHTSAELMLLHLVNYWFKDRFPYGYTYLYTLCMQFVLAPNWPAMYVVCMPSVGIVTVLCHPHSHVVLLVWCG